MKKKLFLFLFLARGKKKKVRVDLAGNHCSPTVSNSGKVINNYQQFLIILVIAVNWDLGSYAESQSPGIHTTESESVFEQHSLVIYKHTEV